VAGEPGDGEDGAGPARVGPAAARQRGPGPSGTGNRADGAQGGPARAGGRLCFFPLPYTSACIGDKYAYSICFLCMRGVREMLGCRKHRNTVLRRWDDVHMY
jgi:hypothetical protein